MNSTAACDLNFLIRRVERRWLQTLYETVKTIFMNTWLPSHDHTHHMRVWTFAKELVEAMYGEGCHFTQTQLEQLIIAVFFHDTGLTRTLDESHGKESRELCMRFLEDHSSLFTGSRKPILEAVEKHDNKSYPRSSPLQKTMPDEILTLLAVCDDLDAFGAIGVFRYLEIYIQRGVPLCIMPEKVLKNIEKRFGYLLQNYGEIKNFLQVHQKRYQYTIDFYRNLGLQYESTPGLPDDTGPVKVVKMLMGKILLERIPLSEIKSHITVPGLDDYSLRYFRQLEKELNE
jgi:HD superfamily phosphodiesterase